jgi:glucuronate isomerase
MFGQSSMVAYGSITHRKMETRKEGLSQVLNRISNAARDRAPLAAEFEDCTQRFDRLGSVMEADESTWEPYQALLNDYRTRLSIWGTEVGSVTIDHTLRKSSHLRSQTLELLEHLQETLQNSTW